MYYVCGMENQQLEYYKFLDDVLRAINDLEDENEKENKQKTYLSLSDIANKLKISSKQLISLHKKLINDGYAEEIQGNTFITFAGVLFLASGGYTMQINELKYAKTKEKILLYGSILAGIWASLQILKMFYGFLPWLHLCQCHI